MITDLDFSAIDTRQSFTLLEVAALWAGYPVATRDNIAQLALQLSALVEAAKRGELNAERATRPIKYNWVTREPRAGEPGDWVWAIVGRKELRRWFEVQEKRPRPPFLFVEERTQPKSVKIPRSRKRDEPTLIDAVKAGGKIEEIRRKYGKPVSDTTIKQIRRDLKTGQNR